MRCDGEAVPPARAHRREGCVHGRRRSRSGRGAAAASSADPLVARTKPSARVPCGGSSIRQRSAAIGSSWRPKSGVQSVCAQGRGRVVVAEASEERGLVALRAEASGSVEANAATYGKLVFQWPQRAEGDVPHVVAGEDGPPRLVIPGLEEETAELAPRRGRDAHAPFEESREVDPPRPPGGVRSAPLSRARRSSCACAEERPASVDARGTRSRRSCSRSRGGRRNGRGEPRRARARATRRRRPRRPARRGTCPSGRSRGPAASA